MIVKFFPLKLHHHHIPKVVILHSVPISCNFLELRNVVAYSKVELKTLAKKMGPSFPYRSEKEIIQTHFLTYRF